MIFIAVFINRLCHVVRRRNLFQLKYSMGRSIMCNFSFSAEDLFSLLESSDILGHDISNVND